MLSAPPLVIVQTPGVDELKLTVSGESVAAVRFGVVPKFCEPGLAKVIVWPATGVTELDAEDAALVPAEFVAVTVNV